MSENYQLDNEKFGKFVTMLRKEKNLTQKELADKLYVSDKTVSKWERGLSIPQVSLLIPMADILDVTVTELLKGERIQEDKPMNIKEVEKLVTSSMTLKLEEQKQTQSNKKQGKILYLVMIIGIILEIGILMLMNQLSLAENYDLFIFEAMFLSFGTWACLFARDSLPVYYDQDKIGFVMDGIVKINLPGVAFNNSNWQPVLHITRITLLSLAFICPFLTIITKQLGQDLIFLNQFIIPIISLIGIYVPILITAKRYE